MKPTIADVAEALQELDRDLFVVVEQDMSRRLRQAEPDRPRTSTLPGRVTVGG